MDYTRFTKGFKKTPEYKAWENMKQRCNNPNYIKPQNYSGRGITVCEEWVNDYDQFFKDMGKRPEGTSLDRIDNDKGYSPNNCRWADIYTQNNNLRSNTGEWKNRRYYIYTGVSLANSGKYYVNISHRNSVIHCGYCDTLEEALSLRLFVECYYRQQYTP